jgi:hypothetical protein
MFFENSLVESQVPRVESHEFWLWTLDFPLSAFSLLRYRCAHWSFSLPLATYHEPPQKILSPSRKLVRFGEIAMFCRKNRAPSRESQGFSTRRKFAGKVTCKIAGRFAPPEKRGPPNRPTWQSWPILANLAGTSAPRFLGRLGSLGMTRHRAGMKSVDSSRRSVDVSQRGGERESRFPEVFASARRMLLSRDERLSLPNQHRVRKPRPLGLSPRCWCFDGKGEGGGRKGD